MNTFVSSIVRDSETIGRDIIYIFRHFLHWTISRFVIVISMAIVMIVASIPAIVLTGYGVHQFLPFFTENADTVNMIKFAYLTPSMNNNTILLISVNTLLGHLVSYIGAIALILIGILTVLTIILVVGLYGRVLIMNVCRSYLTDTPLPYRANLYFSWRHMSRFIGIVSWAGIYLLLPIIILATAIMVDVVLFAASRYPMEFPSLMIGADTKNMFLVVALLGILSIIPMVYICVRTVFALVILVTDPVDALRSGHEYVHESMCRTRGKFWSIVCTIVPFWVTISIITLVLKYATGAEHNTFNTPNIIMEIILILLLGGIQDMVVTSLGIRVLAVDKPQTSPATV